ncbi:hypothetical protein BKA64DRAFT_692845 [Cadophora sp. MPI-SDFR-AT-0126]|nr:hypothetical protein BKA64DRAFT_692845 [Leotiomycetes sp. MPI-SDFR-AT-0126]
MISEKVYKLCTSKESVSALLAKDPTLSPGEAWKQLFGGHEAGDKESISIAKANRDNHTSEDLKRARECVILATNYWQNSVASKYITNAMRELSRRAGKRGEKIVFKLEYDRGSAKQALNNHMPVSQKEYMGTTVNIPAPEDIPFIDLQVVNYHRPMVGTFHCKYMVVDRKYAVLQSNNIQDNDNMEMMTHLEGPIVDSLYDMALISWNNKLDPPLPSANSPAVQGGVGSFNNDNHNAMFDENGAIKGHSAVVHPDRLGQQKAYEYHPRDVNQPDATQPSTATARANSSQNALTGPGTNEDAIRPTGDSETSENDVNGITDGMKRAKLKGESQPIEHKDQDLGVIGRLQENAKAVAVTGDVDHIPHPEKEHHGTVSNLVGNKKVEKRGENQSSNAPGVLGPDAETKQFLSEGSQQLPQSQIEHPSPENKILPEHTTDDPHYDVDIAGEVARVQTAVSPKSGETRIEAVTRHLNHTKNAGFKGNAPECEPEEEMTPYIPHPVHEPFPIAMVCREPYGTPNHRSVYNPQNEVWLSALRNAEKNVFIQSPTLNAEPLVPAIIEACERGIDVYCYICLGYNDTGELLPKQGGTNEMIAHKMYTTLSPEGKQKLHYFFYIGKDQTVPIVAKKKKRDCHIKVMIVDEHIGIQGNGNQDTQSWYHSQEINVMFDSALVCKAWIDGLRRNQNTHLYGEVGKMDGVWRDQNGHEASDVIGVDPGRFAWAKGFMGAIRRVRGAGDF